MKDIRFTRFSVARTALFISALVVFSGPLPAETVTWTAGNGYWNDAANWKTSGGENRIPAEGDDVVFPDGGASGNYITITNATPHLASLTVKRSKTLQVYGWNTKIHADTISFTGGGGVLGNDMNARLCVPATSNATQSNRIWIVAKSLSVDSLSHFYGIGWAPSRGPGWDGVDSKSGPGAYGGLAVSGTSRTYGSISEPLDMGTGGSSSANGKGGPAIRIEVETLVVDGLISADAESVMNSGVDLGSGGSVYITCDTITGSGSVTACGGSTTFSLRERSASGGGGRIAVHYDPVEQKTVTCQVSFSARGGVGWGSSDQSVTRYASLGRAGTVWFTDDTLLKRPGLMVAGKMYHSPDVTRFKAWTGENLAFTNTLFELEAGDGFDVAGDISFSSGSARAYGVVSYHPVDIRVEGDVTLKGANFRLLNGGSIAVKGDFTQVAAASDVSGAEITFQASPTNGTEKASENTITVGGKWHIGAHCGVFPKCSSTNGASVAMHAGAFVLDETGLVSASSAGWAGRYGPGSPKNFRYGASHGGRGVEYRTPETYESPSRSYGDPRCPTAPGSGGSGESSYRGAAGGGVIRIVTDRSMTIDGKITANGGVPGNYQSSGAGGSVYLVSGGALRGTAGVIEAKGGNAGGSAAYGAGGGGRIALWYRTKAPDLALDVSAAGGTGHAFTAGVRADGEEGSVYWRACSGLALILR